MEPQNTPDVTLLKDSDQQKESDRIKGRTGAWLFSGLLIALILFFSIEKLPDGTWGRSTNPPLLVWGMLIPMLAVSLGVPIDAETVGGVISKLQGKE